MMPTKYPICHNGRWGYIDASGKVVIAPQFLYADGFSDNLALVIVPSDRGDDGIRGFIDHTGKVVIGPAPPSGYSGYDDWKRYLAPSGVSGAFRFGSFQDGRARFFDDVTGRYGYIDTAGSLCIACKYRFAADFSDGVAVVTSADQGVDRVLLIDRDGVELCMLPSDMTIGRFHSGVARFFRKRGGRFEWGYVTSEGRVVVPPEYRLAHAFSDGRGLVCDANGKCGYIDETGNVIIPIEFDQALSFTNGVAFVVRDGEGMIIDKSGQEIAKCNFECSGLRSYDSSDGMFIVTKEASQQNLWVISDSVCRPRLNSSAILASCELERRSVSEASRLCPVKKIERRRMADVFRPKRRFVSGNVGRRGESGFPRTLWRAISWRHVEYMARSSR